MGLVLNNEGQSTYISFIMIEYLKNISKIILKDMWKLKCSNKEKNFVAESLSSLNT